MILFILGRASEAATEKFSWELEIPNFKQYEERKREKARERERQRESFSKIPRKCLFLGYLQAYKL